MNRFRSAALVPATLDRENRTVEVTAVSGFAPFVQRKISAPDGSPAPWIEELDAAGADLSVFVGGPLLRDHQGTTAAHVGAVESARVVPGPAGAQIIARVRFSAKPAAEELFQDVAAGLLRGVSIGYRATRWAAAGMRDGLKVFRAIALQPFELSLTPMPADAGATVRSTTMDPETVESPAAETPPPAVTPPPPVVNDNQPASDRRAINSEIRSMTRAAGLPVAFADGLIDEGASVEQARSRAFAEMQRRGVMLRTETTVSMGESGDDPAIRRRAMATALAARLAPSLVKPDDHARAYTGFRSLDMAGELATARGERVNLRDAEALFRSASHSSGDFPLLLQDAGNKILLAAYQVAAPTYRKFAASRPFSNFKEHKFLRAGEFPAFQDMAENGELKYGTMSENRETVTPKEFAVGFTISRRALVNDDLGALGDFSSMIATRAAADENSKVYGVIAGNGPTMSDGKALFHADHGNKAASGGAITVATVGAARAAMRKRKTLDGLPLNIEGTLLVVGPDKELEARQLLAAISPSATSDVNPWSGSFELVVDSAITGNRWYVFANPGQFPTVVYGYVSGNDGPQILTERDFDTQGIRVRAGLDFACGAIDTIGAYLNEGN